MKLLTAYKEGERESLEKYNGIVIKEWFDWRNMRKEKLYNKAKHLGYKKGLFIPGFCILDCVFLLGEHNGLFLGKSAKRSYFIHNIVSHEGNGILKENRI